MSRRRKSRRMSPPAGVTAIGLALQLLAVPATGLTSLPLPSLVRMLPSMRSLLRRSSEHPLMTMQRPLQGSSSRAATATRAFEVGGSGTAALTLAGRPNIPGLRRRLGVNVGQSPWMSRSLVWGEGVVCGAGRGDDGGGEGAVNNEDEDEDNPAKNGRFSPGDDESPVAGKQVDGGGDDSPLAPGLSFSAIEDELRTRSAKTTEKTRTDVVRGGGEASDEERWWPRILPPPLPGQGDDDGDAIQPLIELPLDGVLLQLFPALLIGVVGLILTVAVQVEAGRFDAMVGENGGAVVITDLRDTSTQQQQ